MCNDLLTCDDCGKQYLCNEDEETLCLKCIDRRDDVR